MEDAHTAVLDMLASNPEDAKSHTAKLSFFGVFDGHGGDKVALFTGQNIHNIIAGQDTFKASNYEQALKDGFLATDRAILNGMDTCLEGLLMVRRTGQTFACGWLTENSEQIRSTRRRYPAARPASA
jgi:serine/threonine protein phosphatase PrpC